MKKIFISVLVLLSFTLGLCPGASAGEKVLKIGISKEPAKLNPVLIPGIYGEALAGNIFDTLISFKRVHPPRLPAWPKAGRSPRMANNTPFI